MGAIQQMMDEALAITTSLDGWAVEMTFTAPDLTTAAITGLHTKHHMGFDTDGNRVSAKNAHVSFSEKVLTDLAYPVRNAKGEVTLIGHLVAVKDSTGFVKNYIIRETYPDETIGLIVCILGDYE